MKAYIVGGRVGMNRKEKKVYLNSFLELLYKLEYVVRVYKLEYIVKVYKLEYTVNSNNIKLLYLLY